MHIHRLTIDGVRSLRAIELEPAKLNWIVGANGAGKTSILEALYALSSGRSFRGQRARWINQSIGVAQIFAEVDSAGKRHRLGLERRQSQWRGRIDGEPVQRLADLARQLAVLVFHPDLHALVEGSPSVRRRFLDHGVFHVEPQFIQHWHVYHRALKQRNAALKSGQSTDPWEQSMANSAAPLSEARQGYLDRLDPIFRQVLAALSLSLDRLEFSLDPGWQGDLSRCLVEQRSTDQSSGSTRSGPHRADLRFVDQDGRIAGRLSRGQQKLVALALVLAQAKLLRDQLDEAPIVALDDLPSELDSTHFDATLAFLHELESQIWITSTAPPATGPGTNGRVFHVEHGSVVE